jgi:hypothetical protein
MILASDPKSGECAASCRECGEEWYESAGAVTMLDDMDMLYDDLNNSDLMYDDLIAEVEADLNGDNPESLNGAF